VVHQLAGPTRFGELASRSRQGVIAGWEVPGPHSSAKSSVRTEGARRRTRAPRTSAAGNLMRELPAAARTPGMPTPAGSRAINLAALIFSALPRSPAGRGRNEGTEIRLGKAGTIQLRGDRATRSGTATSERLPGGVGAAQDGYRPTTIARASRLAPIGGTAMFSGQAQTASELPQARAEEAIFITGRRARIRIRAPRDPGRKPLREPKTWPSALSHL